MSFRTRDVVAPLFFSFLLDFLQYPVHTPEGQTTFSHVRALNCDLKIRTPGPLRFMWAELADLHPADWLL